MTTVRHLSRRTFLGLSISTAASATLAACGPRVAQPQVELPITSPDAALQRLVEGNERFVAGKSTDINESLTRRTEVASGQKPFAVVFSCVDSRVPPELVFDRGLGDLLVIRTAGHVIDDAALGSIEFGVAEMGIPLVMVMGHGKCGAVKATIETLEAHAKAPDKIDMLVQSLTPAVEHVHGMAGDELENAVKENVKLTVAALKNAPILSEALQAGKLKVVGSFYALDTGKVEMIVS